MLNKILFVLEGDKEKSITENLTQFFVNEKTLVTCTYCTTIYKMYKEICADEDLDTFNLLKDTPVNKELLKAYKRTDFAEIYLFFDYDGHASNANDEKMKELLRFFNEETEKGKLYISYPMVEALKHVENFESFMKLTVSKKINKYKKIVNASCRKELVDFNLYSLDTWKQLITIHLKKMNGIVNDSNEFPNELINQIQIFNKQLTLRS